MTKNLKILFFDLENVMRPEHIFHPGKRGRMGGRAAGFCSNLAYMLVFGYKWLGKPAKSIQLTKAEMKKDPLTDAPLLPKAFEIMNEADMVVTWYGKGHDFPFLNSRLAQSGLYLDVKTRHLDLYDVAKRHLRLSSNRLDAVAEYFGLPQKMKVSPLLWADCWAGKHSSLMEMAEYCRQDCEVLACVYEKMLPLITTLPTLGKYSDVTCPTCSKESLVSNGYRVTKSSRYVRLRCTSCGSHTIGDKINE